MDAKRALPFLHQIVCAVYGRATQRLLALMGVTSPMPSESPGRPFRSCDTTAGLPGLSARRVVVWPQLSRQGWNLVKDFPIRPPMSRVHSTPFRALDLASKQRRRLPTPPILGRPSADVDP